MPQSTTNTNIVNILREKQFNNLLDCVRYLNFASYPVREAIAIAEELFINKFNVAPVNTSYDLDSWMVIDIETIVYTEEVVEMIMTNLDNTYIKAIYNPNGGFNFHVGDYLDNTISFVKNEKVIMVMYLEKNLITINKSLLDKYGVTEEYLFSSSELLYHILRIVINEAFFRYNNIQYTEDVKIQFTYLTDLVTI